MSKVSSWVDNDDSFNRLVDCQMNASKYTYFQFAVIDKGIILSDGMT